MPEYFSGTNCRAEATLVPDSGRYIALAILSIAGEVVQYYWELPNEPHQMSVALSTRFDSTYFESLTVVNVEVEAYDNLGGYYNEEASSVVINDASSFNRFSFTQSPYVGVGNGAAVASYFLEGANYAVELRDDEFWNPESWRTAVQWSTLL